MEDESSKGGWLSFLNSGWGMEKRNKETNSASAGALSNPGSDRAVVEE